MPQLILWCMSMSEGKVNCWFDEHSGAHVVAKSDHDAQRLRADTAEAGVQASVEVINSMHDQLAAAEQRIAEQAGLLREVADLDPRGEFLGWQLDARIDAALNPKPEAGSHE